MSEPRRRSICEWFDSTLYTRLDDKRNDVIIIVMQRLHLDDLVGHVLAKGEHWERLDLPATAEFEEQIPIGRGKFHHRRAGDLLQPEREPQSVLNGLKISLGNFAYSAQYQQSPIPLEGGFIKLAWFKRYRERPKPLYGDQVVQSWDTASKAGELNDYSVCTTWLIRGTDYYLLHVQRRRMLYPELRAYVIGGARAYSANAVLIEDNASGMALAQDLQHGELGKAGRPITIEPEGDKITRASAQSLVIESGRVFLPEADTWLTEFQNEIVQFPFGKHDDQVDSMSLFLQWANKPRRGFWRMELVGI